MFLRVGRWWHADRLDADTQTTPRPELTYTGLIVYNLIPRLPFLQKREQTDDVRIVWAELVRSSVKCENNGFYGGRL